MVMKKKKNAKRGQAIQEAQRQNQARKQVEAQRQNQSGKKTESRESSRTACSASASASASLACRLVEEIREVRARVVALLVVSDPAVSESFVRT